MTAPAQDRNDQDRRVQWEGRRPRTRDGRWVWKMNGQLPLHAYRTQATAGAGTLCAGCTAAAACTLGGGPVDGPGLAGWLWLQDNSISSKKFQGNVPSPFTLSHRKTT